MCRNIEYRVLGQTAHYPNGDAAHRELSVACLTATEALTDCWSYRDEEETQTAQAQSCYKMIIGNLMLLQSKILSQYQHKVHQTSACPLGDPLEAGTPHTPRAGQLQTQAASSALSQLSSV